MKLHQAFDKLCDRNTNEEEALKISVLILKKIAEQVGCDMNSELLIKSKNHKKWNKDKYKNPVNERS